MVKPSQLKTLYLANKNRYVVLLVYALLTGVGLLYHEPWRDETHSWLIVHQSPSLPTLFHNIRYEGHPILWYLLLYAATFVNGNFETAQLLHWVMTIGSAYLLLTYAPFPFAVRTGLLFSYFLFYEYAILTRNYAPGLLLLFSVCSLFPLRHQFKGHVLLCGMLFLLFQTNVFALLIGLTLYGVLLLEAFFYRRATMRRQWKQYLLGLGIVGAGLLVCLATILKPADAGFPYPVHGGWTHWNITLCTEMIWNAFVPLPARIPEFWNTNVLELLTNIRLRTVLRASLSAFLVIVVIAPLFSSRLALTGWLLVCVGMLFFMVSEYFGQLRHHGHFVVGLLVFLWIQPQLADYQLTGTPIGLRLPPSFISGLAGAVLVLQVVAGALSYGTDLRYSFSANQQTAAYIASGPAHNWFWMGEPNYIAEGIAASLPQNRMYYPSNGQHGGFLRWTTAQHLNTLSQLIDSAQGAHQSPTLLILNRPVAPDSAQFFQLTLLKRFVNNIQSDENYYLYRYSPRP